jgi:hypothetical protein
MRQVALLFADSLVGEGRFTAPNRPGIPSTRIATAPDPPFHKAGWVLAAAYYHISSTRSSSSW